MFSLGATWILIAGLSSSPSASASGESEPLTESWSSYYYYVGGPPDYPHAWQSFSGLSDSEGNLYWELWQMAGRVTLRISCWLRSTDRDGNERFQIPLIVNPTDAPNLRHLVAGSTLVTNQNARVTARSTSDGSVLWTRDFSDEFPREPYPRLGGLAHDGNGLIVSLVGSAVVAMAVADGETIWRRDLGSENPEARVGLESPVLDEEGNLFLGKRLCVGSPEQCRWFLISLAPDGTWRFETETDPQASVWPVAVANGRVVLGAYPSNYTFPLSVFDAKTGLAIVRLPRNVANVLLSRDSGFFIQEPAEYAPDLALVAFDLTTGEEQWRMLLPGDARYYEHALLLTDVGNILVSHGQSTEVWPVLEVSPQGELVQTFRLSPPELRPSELPCDIARSVQLLRGRWFSQACYTVVAYDLPGAPDEGVGWSSVYGNAQHEWRPRTR